MLAGFLSTPSEKVSEFLAELRECLSALPDKSALCLVGDFNVDLLKFSKHLVCEYLTLLSDLARSWQRADEPANFGPTREELF